MNTKYYNPVLAVCLTRCIQARDWAQLYSMLKKLSNTDFRNAESLIAEVILPEEDNDGFWLVYNQLVRYRCKAFMVCIVRSTARLVSSGKFSIASKNVKPVFEFLNGESLDVRMKFVKMILPLIADETEADRLFSEVDVESEEALLNQCLLCGTEIAYYTMFKHLKQNDAERDVVVSCIKKLIKTKTDKAFNMASVLQSYFDVEKQHGVYALKLEPYEMNYLDSSYKTFLKVLNRI